MAATAAGKYSRAVAEEAYLANYRNKQRHIGEEIIRQNIAQRRKSAKNIGKQAS